MSDFNVEKNRAVWFDIPVADLNRACDFYAGVLSIHVQREKFDSFEFAVLAHQDGNGGCLVPNAGDISDKGVLLYLNVDGRIRDAVSKATSLGGRVIQDTHALGPHGFRAVLHDSEGNRLALHSRTDA